MRINRLRLLVILGVVVGSLAAVQAASAALLPLEVSPPSISGSAEQGQTVSCSSGSWLNSPSSYSYNWQRDATTSIGGSSNSYTLTAADVNHLITCTVVAHNGAGASLPAISAPVVPVALPVASVPVETAAPAISGTAQQGQAVDCSQGSWANNPTSYSYSWQRDATAIAGATGSSYTLTSADVNQAITCTVVAHNGSGDSTPAVSAPVVPLALPAPPIETGPPVISGSAEQGQTVSCSTGAWTDGPTSYSYSWQRSGLGIAGQTGSTYTLTSADVNQAVTCTVVAHNDSGDSVPATSAPITPVALPVALVPVEATPPTISGSPEQGQTVNCSTGGWANNPTSYSYSWQRNATAIGGATGPSYTLSSADVNQAVTCTVVAHNGAGDSAAAVSDPIVPVALPTPPVETAPPSISGSPEQGQTVTCSTGSWLNGPTGYSYSWQRDGSSVSGQTASTYALTGADVNHAITCTVVARNGAGDSAPAISAPIVPVALPVTLFPVETAPPLISGSPEQGQTVSCSNGSWQNSPTSYSYSWQRNGSAIGGATGSGYTLTSADVNAAITCIVIAHNGAGDSAPAISPPITPVALPVSLVPVETAPPLISGSPEQGQTVSCSNGSWANSPTSYSYSWQRDGSSISSAAGSSYTLTSADVNAAITCTVVAHNGAGDSAPAISPPIVPVSLPLPLTPVETAPPTISGSPEQGQTVSCSNGSWSNSPTSYAYSWQRDGSSISGAIGSTYQLVAADVNHAVTCMVVAHNGAGDSAPAISPPIVPVALPIPLVPVETAPPTISGSPEQDQTVSCSTGRWAQSPTSFAYSWQRNGAAISGAVDSNYTLTNADVNHAVTCTVIAHNGTGDSAPAISVPIVPVAVPAGLVPIETAPPVISGTPQQGQTVSCSNGSWTNGPTSYTYGWQRDGSSISGATDSSYKLAVADVDHAVTCTVVARNDSGDSAPAISPPIVPLALPIPLVPVETAPPVISGSPEQGQTVSCSNGSWSNGPTSYTYGWQRNGSVISGAAGSSYTLTSADVNHAVTCTVIAHNGTGDSAPAISPPIVPVALPAGLVPIETAPPLISGSPEQGQTVTCSTGSWLNKPTSHAYSWQRDGSTIAGATGSTYKLAAGDVSHAVTCSVVARNAAGDSAPAISPPILPVALPVGLVPIETAPPVISGSPQQGQTVACSNGNWLNSPTSYSYGWQRNGSAISGSTGSTYKLTSADVDAAVTCTVVAHNAAGDSAPATSVPIVAVGLPVGLVPVETAPPLISGSPEQGQTVSCSNGAWQNNPTSYSYTWQRDGSTIGGAAGPRYALTQADVTQAITCTVLAHNAAGDSAPAISVPIVPLALVKSAVPVETAPPVISGSPQQGQTVSCLAGSWTNNPTSFTYTWQRAGAAIAGATSPSYTLASVDVGKPITCTVVALNAAGLSAPGISLPIVPIEGSNSSPAPVTTTTTVVTTSTPAPTPSPAPRPAPIPAKPVATPAKLKAPTVMSLSVSPGKLKILVKGKHRSTKGTTLRYALDDAAGVLIEIQQSKTGRKSGSRCLAVTKFNRRARHCTRWVTVRVLAVRHAQKGANRFKYLGRVGKKGKQLLVAGKYRVYVAANNKAGWSKLRSASFRAVRQVVKPPKKKRPKKR